MKKVFKSLLSFVLAFILVIPVFLTGCDNDKQPKGGQIGGGTEPATIEASDASVVIAEVVEEVDGVMNKMASAATEDVPQTVVQNIMAVDTETTNWTAEGVSSYLYANEWPLGFVYTVDFIVRNATKENGYANGFQYDQVYTGTVEVYEYIGYASIIITVDVEANKVIINMDFDSNDQTVSFAIDMFIDYDFATDTAEKLTVVYSENIYFTDVCYAEYNFADNNFKYLHSSTYSTDGQEIRAAHAQEFLTAYNDGSLDLNKIVECGVNNIDMISGNISDNRNNLNFYSYNAYNYNPYIQNLNTEGWHTIFYNSLYNDAKAYKLRTTKIDITSTKIATYIRDAANYGFTKSEVYSWEYQGKEYYAYPFVEYTDMLRYLSEVKNQIDQDLNANQQVKNLIASANGFVSSRGDSGYTMHLGAYEGEILSLSYNSNYNQNGIYFTYRIFSKSTSIIIMFDIESSTVKNIKYFTVTGEMVRNACDYAIEHQDLQESVLAFVQGLKNRTYSGSSPFNASEDYFIENIYSTKLFNSLTGSYDMNGYLIYIDSTVQAEEGKVYYLGFDVSEDGNVTDVWVGIQDQRYSYSRL